MYFYSVPFITVPSYPVNDASRVKVFDTAQHLVEQVGHSLMVKLHLDHLAQVGVHQLHH